MFLFWHIVIALISVWIGFVFGMQIAYDKKHKINYPKDEPDFNCKRKGIIKGETCLCVCHLNPPICLKCEGITKYKF